MSSLIELRLPAFLGTPFVKKPSKKLREVVAAGCASRLLAAGGSGGVLDAVSRRGALSALLTIHADSASIPGIRFAHLNLDFRNGANGQADAAELLRRNRRRFDDQTLCFALASRPRLRQVLAEAGFATESVILIGPVREGLASLIAKLDPPTDLAHLGLELRPIRSDADIASVLRLFKSEFGKRPQYGRWAGDARYLRTCGESMREALSKRALNGFVICRGRRILGYCGYYPSASSPVYPAIAGVEIVLAEAIQGLGIAKTCYRVMLERLNQDKIALIRGGTAQPAVMGLAKVLRRRPFAYLMRWRSKDFAESHFA